MMSRFFTKLLVVVALAALGQSVWEYRLERGVEQTTEALARVVGERPGYDGEDLLSQARAVQVQAEGLARWGTWSNAAQVLNAKTRLQVYQFAKQAASLCEGVTQLTQSLSRMPHSAESYVLLLEMFAHLHGEVDCTEKVSFSFSNALAAVQRQASVDTTLLYRSGIAALGLGDAEQGLGLISKAQALDPGFSTEQKSFLFDLVYNRADLKTSLVAAYPALRDWVEYFYTKRRYSFDLWQQEFVAATHHAVSDLDQRFGSGRIELASLSSALKDIATLAPTYLDDSLRKRLDVILQRIYAIEGASRWSAFIDERSRLQRVPVLKGIITDDRDARAQQLYGWLSDTASHIAAFDMLGNAIGLYIPKNWSASYILVQGKVGSRVEKDLALDVWVSQDNTNYYPVKLDQPVQQLTVDGIDRLVIPARSLTTPYVKIRYRGSNQNPQLVNSYASLVEVYGAENDS